MILIEVFGMPTKKLVLLAGRIYSQGSRHEIIDFPDKSSTTPQVDNLFYHSPVEDYNCRMLRTELGRTYCRERCANYENCLRGGR